MKNLTRVIALIAIFAAPALAENAHQHGDDQQQGAAGMQDHQMESMHKHMEEMKAQMEQIKNEQDPEKRQQLLQEHREAMHAGMEKMRGGMGSGQKMASMNKEDCMSMMDEHMGMMQMMMEQMMGHQTEVNKSQGHDHNKP